MKLHTHVFNHYNVSVVYKGHDSKRFKIKEVLPTLRT